MYPYFRKYGILLLIVVLLASIARAMANGLANPLINQSTDLQQVMFWKDLLTVIIIYLVNVIVAGVVLSDLLKNKIKALPIVLLTLVSYLAGVVLFLFVLNHKITSHEK